MTRHKAESWIHPHCTFATSITLPFVFYWVQVSFSRHGWCSASAEDPIAPSFLPVTVFFPIFFFITSNSPSNMYSSLAPSIASHAYMSICFISFNICNNNGTHLRFALPYSPYLLLWDLCCLLVHIVMQNYVLFLGCCLWRSVLFCLGFLLSYGSHQASSLCRRIALVLEHEIDQTTKTLLALMLLWEWEIVRESLGRLQTSRLQDSLLVLKRKSFE